MYTFDDKSGRWKSADGKFANNRDVNSYLVQLETHGQQRGWRPVIWVAIGLLVAVGASLLWKPVQGFVGWLSQTTPADLMDALLGSLSLLAWLLIITIIILLIWFVRRARANRPQPAPVTQTVQTTRTVRTTKQEPAPASSDQTRHRRGLSALLAQTQSTQEVRQK